MIDGSHAPFAGMSRRDVFSAGAVALAAGLTASAAVHAQDVAATLPASALGRVLVEQRGAVLLIGIDRPQAQNRADPAIIVGLGKALYRFEHDDDLRVAVMYGTGADFCLGIDVPAFVAGLASGLLPVKDPDFISPLGLQPPLRSKPIVVAVQGGVKYAGHEMFLAADIRVAASDTVFCQGEVTRGIFPGGGATVRFPREAGWGNAMRYMLTGDEWGADEAHRMGLVQEITPPGKQLDRAISLAGQIAAAAPLGVRAILASSHQALAADEATALAAVQPELARLFRSDDAKEAQRALRERRAPVYRGL